VVGAASGDDVPNEKENLEGHLKADSGPKAEDFNQQPEVADREDNS
jgi:hypothetical protein